VSGFFVLLGLIALFQIWRGAANLGIDFAGGTAVQLKFERPISIEKAREILLKTGLAEVELQEFSADNKLLVRVKAKTTIEEKVADKVLDAFRKNFPDNAFVVDASTEIGPTIGQKLQKDARDDCPFVDLPSKQNGQWVQGITPSMMKKMHWVHPVFVCQIKFSEWTRDGKLRQPVFLGLREDKDARQVTKEG